MENVSISIQVNLPKLQQQNLTLRDISSVVIFVNLGISIIGVAANVANIATFVKQGFKESIDISLTALAIADMASLFFLLWMCMCFSKSFCDLVCDVFGIIRVLCLTAGVPRGYFTLVSGVITSIVACERCLCVVKPLRVKVIFTKRRLGVALPSVFLAVMGPFVPLCVTTGLGWMFDPDINRTVLALTFIENRHEVDNVCFGTMVAMGLLTYITVFVCTSTIVWKLASQSAWRSQKTVISTQSKSSATGESKSLDTGFPQDISASEDHAASMDSKKQNQFVESKKKRRGRDRRATQTVTLIAAMYIVCFCPGAVLQLVMACEPEFNEGMKYSEYFHLSWSFAYLSEAICSSTNILIYLKTSSRFRKTFLSHFGVSNDA